jgi:ubiquinol-cytochrome c reductase cytochrome c1 subunit
MSRLSTAGAAALILAASALQASAQIAEAPEPIAVSWQHDGVLGSFNRTAAQRGFQVYREVCSACHGLTFIAFRNLAELGFSEEQVRALAAEYTVSDGPDDTGEMFERPAVPADPIPPPYPNPQAARAANGGALPPELSLITKARAGGADYVYSLMVGYADPPADAEGPEGTYYNAYFPGHWIAMPPPLSEGQVQYADGTEASVDQMAMDVATFLTWAAEPTLEQRKQIGLKVMLFLVVFTGLCYATMRKVWADAH